MLQPLFTYRSNLTSPMPSPTIPHSKSAPDITSPQSPPPPSSKSVVTSRSASSPLTTWPRKLGALITGKNKNSDLTEEGLREFNRRNAIIEARYSSSSPYYKGLTDFSLVIKREKHSGLSPGRDSYVTGGSSKSSFVVKVQEWGGSCFTSKKNDQTSTSSFSSWTKSSHDNRLLTSASSSSSRVTETVVLTKIRTQTIKNDSVSVKKRVTIQSTKIEDTFISPTVKKPLRERDSRSPPPTMLPLSPPIASPPPSLPYPLPQITPPTSQASLSPPPTPPLDTLPSQLYPSPPTIAQAPPPSQPPASGGETCERKEGAETERIYKWADKYRPFWLQEFLCNREKALWLQEHVRSWQDTAEECGHFIFEGNPGVGKRTMIWAFLREAFGEDKIKARKESKEFLLKGEVVSSICVNLMVSMQHVEVNLSELKGYEKHVIVELIKEKSQILCNQENCRAIVLHDADKLSTDALSYIKWMLEKFKGCNKVIFCCRNAKKLQHILPLCRYVQLSEPSIEEIIRVLEFVAENEGIQLPHQLAYKIASNSQNNLRQAIRSFEATWHANGCNASLKEDQDIKTGWEDKIANIANNILEEQSPKQLYHIRGELQNLIEHNVAPEFIFQTLKEELKKILPEQLQPEFDHLYDEYHYQKNHAGMKYLHYAHQEEELGERQNDQKRNVQKFMRIEEFIARFMSWYKGLVVKHLVV